jgi:hypothetical protein
MNKIIKTIALVFFISLNAFTQDCEIPVNICKKNLRDFISDGQVYKASLDQEKVEFKSTFFGGFTYRVTASTGTSQNVIFTVKDLKGNVLFSNKAHKKSPFWDFYITKSLTVIIETEFVLDKKTTGCAVMLIGFHK